MDVQAFKLGSAAILPHSSMSKLAKSWRVHAAGKNPWSRRLELVADVDFFTASFDGGHKPAGHGFQAYRDDRLEDISVQNLPKIVPYIYIPSSNLKHTSQISKLHPNSLV